MKITNPKISIIHSAFLKMTKVIGKELNKSTKQLKLKKEINRDSSKRKLQTQIILKGNHWLEMDTELNWVELKDIKKETLSSPLTVNKLD